jgi:hypothetical protein
MRVSITTDGGFTGRGIGSAQADVDDAAIASARAEEWRDAYECRGADLVRYTLTIGNRSVSWSEGAELPQGLRELFDRVWGR